MTTAYLSKERRNISTKEGEPLRWYSVANPVMKFFGYQNVYCYIFL